MPRGPHPQDKRLFGALALPKLRSAVHDLSWLLSRGYVVNSGLKIVGDRFALVSRQREAVRRSSCSDAERVERAQKQHPLASLSGRRVAIDGFNLIIIVESAMAGGFLMRGRDGALRDLASVHGSYRRAEHSHAAIGAIGHALDAADVAGVDWYLDRPVSNSGRLAHWIREAGEAGAGSGGGDRDWCVELVNDPDKVLVRGDKLVISSDGWVISRAQGWVDFVGEVLRRSVADAWLASLAPEAS